MSDAHYNPFLQRNAPPPPLASDDPIPPIVQHAPERGIDDDQVEEFEASATHGSSVIPFHFALDGNDLFSKWFWSFAPAAVVVGVLMLVIIQLLLIPLFAANWSPGIGFLISAAIAAVYGAIHATWRMGKICRAIDVDYEGIQLTFGSRPRVINPLQVDAILALSGIDLNGEGKGFSNLRSIALLIGSKVEKIGFEPISNARIFDALREVCQHAWTVPAEGSLLPPSEIADHHSDRAGIDSLRRLRKYYGRFVMQLTFSSVSLIVLMLVGGVLLAVTMGVRGIRVGGIKLLFFAGGMVLAALSSLRRIPRELAILRKIKETEKSLAVALGIEYAR